VPKRLLIVTYHHPPDGSVGGLRWAALSKYLVRAGWSVELIAGAPGVRAGIVNGVAVRVVRRLPTLNDAYRAVARLSRGGRGAGGSGPSRGAERPAGFWRRLRWEAASLLAFPDESRGWTLRAAWAVRRAVKRFRPDVVIASGPPHTAHVAAALGLLGRPVPLVLDFRDPWSLREDAWRFDPVYGTEGARFLIRHLEAWVMKRSNVVIANTRELADLTRARYPDAAVTWLRNGLDLEDVPPGRLAPFPGLSLCHVGTLYGNRDVRPVLAAFRAFLDRHPDAAAAGSRLRIAGAISPRRRDALLAQIEVAGLVGAVEVLGILPRPEALRLVRRSSLSLVLAQDQGLGVPAKLYESLAAGGGVTLVLTEPGSANAREAAELGARVCEASDTAGITALLERIWRDVEPPPAAPVDQFSYERLAERLADLLDPRPAPVRRPRRLAGVSA